MVFRDGDDRRVEEWLRVLDVDWQHESWRAMLMQVPPATLNAMEESSVGGTLELKGAKVLLEFPTFKQLKDSNGSILLGSLRAVPTRFIAKPTRFMTNQTVS